MKRFFGFIIFLSSIFLVLFSIFQLPSSILHAQDFTYTKAYQDYLYNFNLYRQSYLEYQAAKSEFQTYQTLTSQTKAIEVTKKMLSNRAATLKTFLTAVRMRIKEDSDVPEFQKNLQFVKLDSEISGLDQNILEISPVSTIADVNNVSQKFEKKYPEIVFITYQAKTNIYSGRINSLIVEIKSEISSLEDTIKILRESGKDVSTLERWLIQARGKESLAEEKLGSAEKIMSTMLDQENLNGMRSIYTKSQQAYQDANQYLKETVTNLKEIINGVKNV
jgi:hypothetical protein